MADRGGGKKGREWGSIGEGERSGYCHHSAASLLPRASTPSMEGGREGGMKEGIEGGSRDGGRK